LLLLLFVRQTRPAARKGQNRKPGENSMTSFILDALVRLHRDDKGQGLVEYLLILALVAFAATAGMGSLASGLNSAFSQVGIIIGQYIT
jgi:pilus assembly protein Flp/PilA